MALVRTWVKLVKRLGKPLTICEIGPYHSAVSSTVRNKVGYVETGSEVNIRSSNAEIKCHYSIHTNVSKSHLHEHGSHLHKNEGEGYSSNLLEKELASLMEHDEVPGSNSNRKNRLVQYCDNILMSVKPSEREKSVDPYKFLKGKEGKINAETHKLLLKCAARKGNIQAALYILSLMRGADHLLNEDIFNSLIELYARTGDVKSTYSNLERMRDSGIEPSSQIWTNVARVHAVVGDVVSMEKVLEAHKEIHDQQLMDLAQTLVSSNNGKYIKQLTKYFSNNANIEDMDIANAIIELADTPNGQNIHPMMNRMTSEIASDRRDTFLENYLKTLVRARIPIEALFTIIDDITAKKKYSFATADVCEAALENGEKDLAMRLFERMHHTDIPLRTHYYWPLLIQAWGSGGEIEIFRTIEHMLRLGVPLDDDTFFYYVFPRINTSDVGGTVAKLRDMSIEPRTFVTPLMCYLLTEEDFESCLFLCAKYASMIDFSKILHPLSVAYKCNGNVEKTVRILSYAPRASGNCYSEELLINIFGQMPQEKDAREIKKFIQTFDKFDIPLMQFSQFGENNDGADDKKNKRNRLVNPAESLRKMPYKILHPREMSVDQLECHLIELRSKEMNKRGVLRKLLMEYCRGKDVKRVSELKKEYDDNGYLWSSGLYSVLFGFYTRNSEIKEATQLYQLLREYHKHFKIDSDKLVSFACALVKEKQIEQAMQVLKSSSTPFSSNSSNKFLSKECWRLLDTVAHSEFAEMTQSILDILVKFGYCEINNAILGPVIRQYLLMNNVEEAVESFKRFARQYKCTPLRQELMLVLLKAIQSNDSSKERFVELLDDVRIIIADIHGSEQSNADIFVGFARAGMRLELLQFFENNHISNDLFVRTLEYISEDEKLSTLNEIFQTCTNLPASHKQSLCEQIVSLYCRSGDCQGAIELCRKMMQADITFSRTFIIKLVNLLKSHKVPVPEDLEIPSGITAEKPSLSRGNNSRFGRNE
ncbi:leucine-rich PPR motif-containing protein, mitochondrial isoform X2 [Venturia canescens]|uniref:leucine-rich PPR motif-containing protein, mitochondrial isoform X2 n=1 Tax=Venturia canescens TaxID=32260 RepID=UPI001C9CDC31|nr:leucine-rich PPR motif-containing protein, mitochondrial isoform X2 [Venturia canescens]